MADRNLQSSIRGVLRRLKVKEIKHLPDIELLERYVANRDEAAFTALVSRHGPTVLSVCLRVLRGQDADDVFQATFLALAKDAGSIRRREAIGAWLYEVAYHAALRAKARRVRDQKVERAAATTEKHDSPDEVVYRDVQQVLDEELHQLPERLRQPLVLVHLLGHVQTEAARQLGITDRGLRKRLQVGRDRLRIGLSRRGVTLTAAALVAVLDQPATAGPVAPSLVGPTVESVLAYAAGQIGAVPAGTVSLAMAGTGGWLAGRFKLIGLLAVPLVATLVFTASALTPSKPGTGNQSPTVASPAPSSRPVELSNRPTEGRTSVLTGQILGADGKPVPRADVSALVRRPWQSTNRGLHDEVVSHVVADEQGRYRLAVPTDSTALSPDRKLTLLAHAAGRAPISAAVTFDGQSAPTDLHMAEKAPLAGRLITPDGRPASGVQVAVVRMGRVAWEMPQGGQPSQAPPGWPADVTTNDRGEFHLDGLPAGEIAWLQVRDDRFALTSFAQKAGVAASAPVKLSEPRLLTGRITAADTGRPMVGARVAAVVGPDRQTLDYYTVMAAVPELAASAAPAEVSGVTDADGRYRLRLPPSAAFAVYAYPPSGAAYVGWRWRMTWAEGETARERSAALPPGQEIRGQVVEEDGRPINGACVMWMHDSSEKPPPEVKTPTEHELETVWANALMFSEMATLTAADGHFRVVVPKIPVILRVFGPSADYRLFDYGYQKCPTCGKEHLRPGEHCVVRVNANTQQVDPVRVTLRRGLTITGRAIGPDGEPIRDGVLVCRTVDQPLRKAAPRLLPIRDGVFQLPGCIAGRVYPVLLLDAAHELAAVAELRINPQHNRVPPPDEDDQDRSAVGRGQVGMPTVRLARCGTATVRLTDNAGRALAGHRPSVLFWLPDDRPANLETHGNGPWSTPLEMSWVDPGHYLPGPVTDADGMVTVTAIVPGLQYHLRFSDLGPRAPNSAPFKVTPGKAGRLPDLVAAPAAEDEEFARPPVESRSKTTDAPEK